MQKARLQVRYEGTAGRFVEQRVPALDCAEGSPFMSNYYYTSYYSDAEPRKKTLRDLIRR